MFFWIVFLILYFNIDISDISVLSTACNARRGESGKIKYIFFIVFYSRRVLLEIRVIKAKI